MFIAAALNVRIYYMYTILNEVCMLIIIEGTSVLSVTPGIQGNAPTPEEEVWC